MNRVTKGPSWLLVWLVWKTAELHCHGLQGRIPAQYHSCGPKKMVSFLSSKHCVIFFGVSACRFVQVQTYAVKGCITERIGGRSSGGL